MDKLKGNITGWFIRKTSERLSLSRNVCLFFLHYFTAKLRLVIYCSENYVRGIQCGHRVVASFFVKTKTHNENFLLEFVAF